MKKVVIIGGGASGIMAAIIAARHGSEVTILEHKDRIGKKILMTGNGKCNLSNLSFSCENYYSDTPEFIPGIFKEFSVEDTLTFFREIGLLTKEKKGYLYPMSEQASTVLDIFRIELNRQHVKIVTDCDVNEIICKNKHSAESSQEQKEKQFQILTSQGRFMGDALIIACGGKAAPQSGSDGTGYHLAESMGHRILTPLPALVQLRCEDAYIKSYMKAVAGVRCEAGLKLYVAGKPVKEESGELQLTDYGISGIPVFQLSRIVSKAIYEKQKVAMEIDLLPSVDTGEIREYLIHRPSTEVMTTEEAMLGMVNKKILSLILKLNQVKLNTLWDEIKHNPVLLDKIIDTIKRWRIIIKATNPFQNAQVCCGGVDCKELKDTLESKKIKNLYFAGEIIDVDGICGGYNLQWAWSTGYVAGLNSSK